jgi:Icc protein
LPGNHDESTLLNSAIDGGLCRYESQLQHNGWQFIFLDSTIPGSEGAHFSAERLQQLDRMLADSGTPHTLVCLHHNPVNMGSRWLDTMALDNQDEFFAVIDRHTKVRGILWGHVHQEFTGTRNGVHLMSTPSTCIQFMPGSSEFALDSSSPGYRWLLLHEDGRIETGVERLDGTPGTVDVSASGY